MNKHQHKDSKQRPKEQYANVSNDIGMVYRFRKKEKNHISASACSERAVNYGCGYTRIPVHNGVKVEFLKKVVTSLKFCRDVRSI